MSIMWPSPKHTNDNEYRATVGDHALSSCRRGVARISSDQPTPPIEELSTRLGAGTFAEELGTVVAGARLAANNGFPVSDLRTRGA